MAVGRHQVLMNLYGKIVFVVLVATLVVAVQGMEQNGTATGNSTATTLTATPGNGSTMAVTTAPTVPNTQPTKSAAGELYPIQLQMNLMLVCVAMITYLF